MTPSAESSVDSRSSEPQQEVVNPQDINADMLMSYLSKSEQNESFKEDPFSLSLSRSGGVT